MVAVEVPNLVWLEVEAGLLGRKELVSREKSWGSW
jgi:hypothetical protein